MTQINVCFKINKYICMNKIYLNFIVRNNFYNTIFKVFYFSDFFD